MTTQALEIVPETQPLTAAQIKDQVKLIQEVMQAVMQKDQHYGTVPGCGNKPTLLKPGAEKLAMTFRLAADPEITDLSGPDVCRYRVRVALRATDGRLVGAGVGEASTDEDKYHWRAAVSAEEFNATAEERRRIKYKHDGTIQQVRTNPSDLANIVLKMAKKRALVDAVLTTTAASDIFTQDIEDMEPETLGKRDTKPSAAAPTGNGKNIISTAQAKRWYAIGKSNKATDGEMKDILARFGYKRSDEIEVEKYDELIEAVGGTNEKAKEPVGA